MTMLMFANNASSRLYAEIDAATTSIRVQDGHGVLFPQPPGDRSETFTVTVEDRRTGQVEICMCYQRSGDILTVDRGQEGTPAQAFAMGATVSNRLTAATMDFLAHAGARGPQGEKGDQGDQGIQGPQGDTGPTGPVSTVPGPPGPKGDQGLKGDTGDRGAPGPQGLPGIQGVKGDQGDIGPQGIKGDKGDQGIQGPQGIQGLKGDKGDKGDQGIQGIQGPIGPTGGAVMYIGDAPPASPVVGQVWWESDTGNQFIWYDDGNSVQWVPTHVGALPDEGTGGGIVEAPTDGQLYSRRGSDASWQVSPSGLDQTTANGLYVNVTGDTMTAPLALPLGAVAAPALAFPGSAAGGTGLFATSTTINIGVGGVSTYAAAATFGNFAVRQGFPYGTTSSPAIFWNNSTNTGFSGNNNTIQFLTNGAVRGSFTNGALTTTVPVVLPADPANALEAATKQYVDSKAGGGGSGNVVGPASSVLNTVARYADTTGKLLKDSGPLVVADDASFTFTNAGQVVVGHDTNTANGTFTIRAKPPHGQTIQITPRSDVNGSCVITGSGNYGFDNPISIGTGSAYTNVGLSAQSSGAPKRALKIDSGVLNLLHDVAPSSPVNGDLWSTTSGFYGRVNGATVGPFGAVTGGKITVASTAPSSPAVNDVWIDTT